MTLNHGQGGECEAEEALGHSFHGVRRSERELIATTVHDASPSSPFTPRRRMSVSSRSLSIEFPTWKCLSRNNDQIGAREVPSHSIYVPRNNHQRHRSMTERHDGAEPRISSIVSAVKPLENYTTAANTEQIAAVMESSSTENRFVCMKSNSLHTPHYPQRSEGPCALAKTSVPSAPFLCLRVVKKRLEYPELERQICCQSQHSANERSPESPASTTCTADSDADTYFAYETPLTTPSSSPTKVSTLADVFADVDVNHGLLDGEGGSPVPGRDLSLESYDGFPKNSGCSRYDEHATLEHDRRTDESASNTLSSIGTLRQVTRSGKQETTAPTQPPEATQADKCVQLRPVYARRDPSSLLPCFDARCTPRRRRHMMSGVRTPDRFICCRASRPIKEASLFPSQAEGGAEIQGPRARRKAFTDPFSSVPSQGRTSSRLITSRPPSRNSAQPMRVGTRIYPDTGIAGNRPTNAAVVWSVGGTPVTEGVASSSNGLGGRITSGTLAPHYTADFVKSQSPCEHQQSHAQRLAVAMDIEREANILQYGSLSPHSTQEKHTERTIWRSCGWEREGANSPVASASPKNHRMSIIPFRVLDAPALRDDFYCSLLAYCHTTESLAVGLGPHVYLWSEQSATQSVRMPTTPTSQLGGHVTSISFSSTEGRSAILAAGCSDGRFTLWSPLDEEPRICGQHPVPISHVCFRKNAVRRQSVREPAATVLTEELLIGDELGNVLLYSIEWPCQIQRDLFDWPGSVTLLARISCHNQQVCGISWSAAGEFFATGGNDNRLFLFDRRHVLKQSSRVPTQPETHYGISGTTLVRNDDVTSITLGQQKHLFTLNAAVKALAFAPWKPSLLAAGGGSNDRCIHFFHALSGARIATIDCHAQVTSLVWSTSCKEIAATFGFAQPEHPYRVAVFAWPSCCQLLAVPWWGEERALFALAYPGGPNVEPARETSTDAADNSSSLPQSRRRRRAGRGARGDRACQRRTREEGTLVIATSDASIKFHEVWADERPDGVKKRARAGVEGVFGGSSILEDTCSAELERVSVIR